jgi:hypothetical protein
MKKGRIKGELGSVYLAPERNNKCSKIKFSITGKISLQMENK